MSRDTWKPGTPHSAQSFTRMSAQELNDIYASDEQWGIKEVALPVSGDLTAILRGRVRW